MSDKNFLIITKSLDNYTFIFFYLTNPCVASIEWEKFKKSDFTNPFIYILTNCFKDVPDIYRHILDKTDLEKQWQLVRPYFLKPNNFEEKCIRFKFHKNFKRVPLDMMHATLNCCGLLSLIQTKELPKLKHYSRIKFKSGRYIFYRLPVGIFVRVLIEEGCIVKAINEKEQEVNTSFFPVKKASNLWERFGNIWVECFVQIDATTSIIAAELFINKLYEERTTHLYITDIYDFKDDVLRVLNVQDIVKKQLAYYPSVCYIVNDEFILEDILCKLSDQGADRIIFRHADSIHALTQHAYKKHVMQGFYMIGDNKRGKSNSVYFQSSDAKKFQTSYVPENSFTVSQYSALLNLRNRNDKQISEITYESILGSKLLYSRNHRV